MLHAPRGWTALQCTLAGLALLLATGCTNVADTITVTPVENQSADDVAIDRLECEREARWMARAPEVTRALADTPLLPALLRAVWLGGDGVVQTSLVLVKTSVRVAKQLYDAPPATVYRACMESRGYATSPPR